MEGYVYIMTNSAMPGLLKIGNTKRSPEERQRELSRPTGVPIAFNVAYDIFTTDINALENYIHVKLNAYRFNSNREFFSYDLYNAIDLLRSKVEEIRLASEFKSKGINEVFDSYEAIEILGQLQVVYPNMIRNEIKSVRIYQTKLRCYLEITEDVERYKDRTIPLIDQKIHRQDMGFILGNEDLDFESLLLDPSLPVSSNARIFIEEFDDYSKLVCCTELFTDEGIKIIENKHFKKNDKI